MITITNMTINGNFDWHNNAENLFVRGNFTKNGENNLTFFYCNMSHTDSQMSDNNVNVYINGDQVTYNINSTDLSLIAKFVNNVNTIISELNNTDNEE